MKDVQGNDSLMFFLFLNKHKVQLRWSYLLHRALNLPWRVSVVAQVDFVPRVGLAPGGVVPFPLAPHVVMRDAEDNDTMVRLGLVLFGLSFK